jgi:uncharacterized membrane protein YgcG
MVSASHNPAKYNGFKLDYSDALPVSAVTGMREIQQLVEHGFLGVDAQSTALLRARQVIEQVRRSSGDVPTLLRPEEEDRVRDDGEEEDEDDTDDAGGSGSGSSGSGGGSGSGSSGSGSSGSGR